MKYPPELHKEMGEAAGEQPPRSAAETLADMQAIARSRLMAPRHAIGDPVSIQATVVGVNFTASKVRYVAQIGDNVAIIDSDDVHPVVAAQPMILPDPDVPDAAWLVAAEDARAGGYAAKATTDTLIERFGSNEGDEVLK